MKVSTPGDDRDQHIAQNVGADLGEDLVADEDDAGPAAVWHQPVQGGADAGHVDQEVHRQHHDDQCIRHALEYGGSRGDHIVENRPAGTVEGVGDSLLQTETLIEPAGCRGVVLDLLNVARRLVYQLINLLDEWGNRGTHEGAQ
jgi:hypothetical protein